MKTKTKKFEGMVIWVDNRKDKEVYVTATYLAAKFKEWRKTKTEEWQEYYFFDGIVQAFMTEPDPGLHSSYNTADYDALYLFLHKVYNHE